MNKLKIQNLRNTLICIRHFWQSVDKNSLVKFQRYIQRSFRKEQ